VKVTKEDRMRSEMKMSGKGTIVTCFIILAQTTGKLQVSENSLWPSSN